jgi:hypothetical protein
MYTPIVQSFERVALVQESHEHVTLLAWIFSSSSKKGGDVADTSVSTAKSNDVHIINKKWNTLAMTTRDSCTHTYKTQHTAMRYDLYSDR